MPVKIIHKRHNTKKDSDDSSKPSDPQPKALEKPLTTLDREKIAEMIEESFSKINKQELSIDTEALNKLISEPLKEFKASLSEIIETSNNLVSKKDELGTYNVSVDVEKTLKDKLPELIKSSFKDILESGEFTKSNLLQDKCSLKTEELKRKVDFTTLLEPLATNNKKDKEYLKGRFEFLYSLKKQHLDLDNFYNTCRDTADTQQDISDDMPSKQNKEKALFSKSSDELYSINTKIEVLVKDLNQQIKNIKTYSLPSFSKLYSKVYKIFEEDQSLLPLVQDYCTHCGGDFRNLEEKDSFIFLATCSVGLIVIDSINDTDEL